MPVEKGPWIEHMALTDFRNYSNVALELSSGLNMVFGQNAQGKTNLIEALALVCTGRLLRPGRDSQAIREGAAEASVGAELAPHGTKVALELRRGGKRRALLNGSALPRSADIMGRAPCVSFTSQDLELVRGDPAARRLFLDVELSQLYSAYLADLSAYKRALEQRNALLREPVPPSAADLSVWEAPLAEHGFRLRERRLAWVARLADFARQRHEILGGGEELGVTYLPKDDSASAGDLARALVDSRYVDIARGFTGVGPHRDDLALAVGGREARLYGSQGQQRTAVIALKLATLEIAREILGFAPLLLLDDIFSDLDRGRRARLVEIAIRDHGQVVLTCTEAEQPGEELARRCRWFQVRSGRVERCDP